MRKQRERVLFFVSYTSLQSFPMCSVGHETQNLTFYPHGDEFGMADEVQSEILIANRST